MLDGRRNHAAQRRGRGGDTPSNVVSLCEAYSQRLKEKPVRVKLHVSVGRLVDGNITLESLEDSRAPRLVVQAKGSNMFGLVKRQIRHAFKVGELERSSSTHTAFLVRSIKRLAKGDEAMKKELLARSLSLVHASEAVDMTFATEPECNTFGDWVDAKWSVAVIEKSFRRNPRIKLALEGKNQSLNDRGVYEAIDRRGEESRGGGGGGGSGSGTVEVDGAGFARLPTLDAATKSKLQDDLLDGLHVTYHDLSLNGFVSTSSPRRLRYDCKSKDGLVFLEASFEGDGETIAEPVSTLIQVGGGPSAHGPTAGLLRATRRNREQLVSAVSLVFTARAMDITCGTEKDARELVLFFSELRGFTRARPPTRSILNVPALQEAGPTAAAVAARAAAKEEPPRPAHSGRKGPGQRATTASSSCCTAEGKTFDIGAAMLNMDTAAETLIVDDALGDRWEKKREVTGIAAATSVADAADSLARGKVEPSFSTRFRRGIGGGGNQDAEAVLRLGREASAASGFGVTPSLRDVCAAAQGPIGGGCSGVAKQRVWHATRQGTAPVEPRNAAAVGPMVFRSSPGPARPSMLGDAPAAACRDRSEEPLGRRGEGEGRDEMVDGLQLNHDWERGAVAGVPEQRSPYHLGRELPPPPYQGRSLADGGERPPFVHDDPPPAYNAPRRGYGPTDGNAASLPGQERQIARTLGDFPGRQRAAAAAESRHGPRHHSPTVAASRGRSREGRAAGRGHHVPGDDASSGAAPESASSPPGPRAAVALAPATALAAPGGWGGALHPMDLRRLRARTMSPAPSAAATAGAPGVAGGALTGREGRDAAADSHPRVYPARQQPASQAVDRNVLMPIFRPGGRAAIISGSNGAGGDDVGSSETVAWRPSTAAGSHGRDGPVSTGDNADSRGSDGIDVSSGSGYERHVENDEKCYGSGSTASGNRAANAASPSDGDQPAADYDYDDRRRPRSPTANRRHDGGHHHHQQHIHHDEGYQHEGRRRSSTPTRLGPPTRIAARRVFGSPDSPSRGGDVTRMSPIAATFSSSSKVIGGVEDSTTAKTPTSQFPPSP